MTCITAHLCTSLFGSCQCFLAFAAFLTRFFFSGSDLPATLHGHVSLTSLSAGFRFELWGWEDILSFSKVTTSGILTRRAGLSLPLLWGQWESTVCGWCPLTIGTCHNQKWNEYFKWINPKIRGNCLLFVYNKDIHNWISIKNTTVLNAQDTIIWHRHHLPRRTTFWHQFQNWVFISMSK